ncbi:MAG: hypothetical protein IKL23_01810, partial [Oscillospiraceae bacterium]|nr:hypothetical protein [Oscillospiraceae bacterium]
MKILVKNSRLGVKSGILSFLQDLNACFAADLQRIIVPKADLHFTDVAGTQHQHTQTALTDTAADGEGQLAAEQSLVEGELCTILEISCLQLASHS